jgi:uncharacterized protein YgbK (DUF1537 family)
VDHQIPKTLIIADDLTGALDAAGPFCDRGLRVATIVDSQSLSSKIDLSKIDVLAVNSDSRHVSVAEATRRIETIARSLDVEQFNFVIKKIDSTLRGNVVAETVFLASTFNRGLAIVAPAFPKQSRTVKKGYVHVAGVKLGETEFAADKLNPAPKESINDLFSEHPDVNEAVLGDSSTDLFVSPECLKVVAYDAEHDIELQLAVDAFHANVEASILVGSSGITSRFAQSLPSRSVAQKDVSAESLLFVVGSRSERSELQVQGLVDRRVGLVAHGTNGEFGALHLDSENVFVLVASENSTEVVPSSVVASRLASTAADVVRSRNFEAVVVTGGDTALALLREMKVSVVEVLRNFVPGIPISRISFAGKQILLLTKAGGFGDPDLFVRIATELLRGTTD